MSNVFIVTIIMVYWENGSEDLHNLIRTMAEMKVAARSRARGQDGPDQELGLVLGEIRRTLSVEFVRAQSLCLLSRLTYLGEGSREAFKEEGADGERGGVQEATALGPS